MVVAHGIVAHDHCENYYSSNDFVHQDRKFLATQSYDKKECEKLTVRDCSSTTHDSDGTSKIKVTFTINYSIAKSIK